MKAQQKPTKPRYHAFSHLPALSLLITLLTLVAFMAPASADTSVLTIHSEQKLASPVPTINTWTVYTDGQERSASIKYALDGVVYSRFNESAKGRSSDMAPHALPFNDIVNLDSPKPSLPLSSAVMQDRTDFSIVREAGGMRFKIQLSPAVTRMTVALARNQGLVRTDALPEDAEVLLYIFHNTANDELVFTQLYAPSLGWWLYESAGPRTSWLTSTAE